MVTSTQELYRDASSGGQGRLGIFLGRTQKILSSTTIKGCVTFHHKGNGEG